jgi:hypothetical protein
VFMASLDFSAQIELLARGSRNTPVRTRILLYSVLSVICFLGNRSTAQTTTSGSLTGVVTDPSGAFVPNAKVEIRDSAKGTIQTAKTDGDGVYRFFFLAPGRYTLTVSHPGFREESQEFSVLLGPPGTRNITLKLAGTSATVKVSDEIPLLQAENGDVSTTMTQKQISEVPNPGNDLTYIAQTAPGAIMNTDTYSSSYLGNFSSLGMPGTSNSFTLNGISNNEPILNTNLSGITGMMLGQNEIQEATVVSDGYSGQFGGAAGTSVNFLTKSGSNAFHGNAQYYWNGSALNANDWIDNALGNPRPFDIAHQWAGSLGGPIKKDKLFFFFDTEGIRVRLPVSTGVVLPSAKFESAVMSNIDSVFGIGSASDKFYRQIFNLYDSSPGANKASPGTFNPQDLGCNNWQGPQGLGTTESCAVHFLENIVAPSNDSLVSGRVDWNLGASDRVFLLVQYGFGNRTTYVDPISPVFDVFNRQSTWQAQLSETHTFGPTAANQFLLAGIYVHGVTSVADSSQALAVFPTYLAWWNDGGVFNPLGGLGWCCALPSVRRGLTYQISDDFVKTRGKHKFEFGVSFQRNEWSGSNFNYNGVGQLSPQSMDAFFWGGIDPDPAKQSTDFTTLNQSFPAVTRSRFAFYRLGLYGQEEWHARANLTVTIALRAEHHSNPVCETHCFTRLAGPFQSLSHDPDLPYKQVLLAGQKQAFANTDSILWSPRFSFAWQPFGVSRNTVLRGGVGIFYDPVAGILSGVLAYNPPYANSFTLTGYNLAPGETNSLTQNALKFNDAFLKGFASGQTFSQIKAADTQFVPPMIQSPAQWMHSPQYQKWSLQLQQSLGSSTSLTVGYFGNHGLHQLDQNPNANAFGFETFPAAVCSHPAIPPCADPRLSGVTVFDTSAISNYHGMVVSFEQRFARLGNGLFQANYTYGHALDEVSNGGLSQFTNGSSIFPQDANNLRGSYGPAEYDVRHSLNANYVWELPLKALLRGGGSDSLVKGWQVSGTIFARTGIPYTVIDFEESGLLSSRNFYGLIYSVPLAPLGRGGPCGKGAAIPASPVPCQPAQVLTDGSPNPGALFLQAGCETGFNTGNLPGPNGPCGGPSVTFAQGRNHFRESSYFNTDFAVMKTTKIPRWENGTLTIGLEFFNFFNHANFGMPDHNSPDSSFGQIFYQEQSPTSILGSGLNANVSQRMIQIRAQLKF